MGSFDFLWTNLSKCTAVPINTVVNHYPSGLWRNTVCLKYLLAAVVCHSVATITGSCNVVHNGQHFPYLRNRFEPKLYDTTTMPKWQSGHIPISGRRLNRHLLYPSKQTNRQITIFFKGYASNEYLLNGEYLYPKTG